MSVIKNFREKKVFFQYLEWSDLLNLSLKKKVYKKFHIYVYNQDNHFFLHDQILFVILLVLRKISDTWRRVIVLLTYETTTKRLKCLKLLFFTTVINYMANFRMKLFYWNDMIFYDCNSGEKSYKSHCLSNSSSNIN